MRKERAARRSLRGIVWFVADKHGVTIWHNAVSELPTGKRKTAS